MNPHSPLAERVRPQTLDDYIGQDHILGEGKALRKSIESGNIPSMILWGPPGVGKTTLARIMANTLKRPFYTLSATDAGVKQVREVIGKAEKSRFMGQSRAVLFIDEIHRFNKSQQDSLLKAVENGTLTLVGATTENPSFEVNAALLSRSEVFVLNQLSDEALLEVLHRAMRRDEILKLKEIELEETEALLLSSGGDARRLLNNLEQIVNQFSAARIKINNDLVKEVIQKRLLRYDKTGEEHYDIVSAFIKSVRGSDPNAALYWLARMIEGGEDPVFIARRLLILSSEDIGNANATAITLATSAMQAVQLIGYPECRIVLAQITIYLACSPKSNTAYKAIGAAQKLVAETGNLPVPLHLRNAPTKLMKDLSYGAGYLYAHQFPGHFVPQEFMPEMIHGHILYHPGNNPRESEWRRLLAEMWKEFYPYGKKDDPNP